MASILGISMIIQIIGRKELILMILRIISAIYM